MKTRRFDKINFKIRKARVDDIAQLCILFNSYRLFYKKKSNKNGARDFLKERLLNKDSEIFVAEHSGTKNLAGFVQLYPLFSSTRMKRIWLLNDLFVATDYRGYGISKQLIQATKKLARESKAAGLLLETAKNNIIGNRLYTLQGFKLEQESNFYTWNNK